MKNLRFLHCAVLFPALAAAQNVNVQKTAATNAITADLTFSTSRSLTIASGGTLIGQSGSLTNFSMVGIGTGLTAPSTNLHVVDTLATSPRGITNDQYNNGTNSAQFNARKARGTFATPLTVVTGDILSRFIAWGYDGANFIESGNLRITSSGTIAATRVPSQMEFYTSTDATPSVLTLAMTLTPAQHLLLNGQGTDGALGSVLQIPSTATAGTALYNTSDVTTNYEMLQTYWTGNTAIIRTSGGGNGVGRNLRVSAEGVGANSSGSLTLSTISGGGNGSAAAGITIQVGDSSNAVSGAILIKGGSSNGFGGGSDITIQPGAAGSRGGYFVVKTGGSATTAIQVDDFQATSFTGNVIMAAGKLLTVPSGTNKRAGNLTLIGGTLTVSNTTVTANTIVMLTRKTSGGTIGTAITYTLSAGVSFTVNSDNILDTSTFSYVLIENP